MKKWRMYILGVLCLVALVLSITGRESVSQFVADHSTVKHSMFNSKPVSVLLVGDMMFDRQLRQVAEKKGYSYLFSCATDTLLAVDAVVGNLEGPITGYKSVSKGSKIGSTDNYYFTFSKDVPLALVLANIGYVNIGNNHIMNFGNDGLKQTKGALASSAIAYFETVN